MSPTVGVWFRKALRLHDNAPLVTASEFEDAYVLPFFVLDTSQFTTERFSVNRFRFLLDALKDVDDQLKKRFGSRTHGLVVIQGPVEEVIQALCKGTAGALSPGLRGLDKVKLSHLFYEFDSGPYGRERDTRVEGMAKNLGVTVQSYGGHTLLDLKQLKARGVKLPTTMSMIQDLVAREFKCTGKDKLDNIPKPKPVPSRLGPLPESVATSLGETTCTGRPGTSEDIPNIPKVSKTPCIGIPYISELYNETPNLVSAAEWPGGETEALKRLHHKICECSQAEYVCQFEKPKTSSTNLKTTRGGKDEWVVPSTTGLSPYLAQGSLSVRQLWHAIQNQYEAARGKHSKPPMSLHGQLLFREQFYLLGYCVENFQQPTGNAMCKDIMWSGGTKGTNGSTLVTLEAQAKLKAWQEGKTGYPVIDAFMRQLVATGWMHHLGRHAVACFLTRGDLYLNWTHGRDFFDKHLLDGDWALNNANWLWLAGVAPFSTPWFRVYSPTPPVTGKQSALNCEQTGEFVRFWVPELSRGKHGFPAKFIYEPWKAPQHVQEAANCIIGKDYPRPIVDHSSQSKLNLDSFKRSLEAVAASKSSQGGSSPLAKRQKTATWEGA